MLSRKVVTRSGRGFRGYFPSKKLNRLVQFESLLERDAIQLFENAKDIIRFKEQPTIIYYYLDGEPKKYYPDFELELSCEQIVHVEVKPSIKLANLEISRKYRAINKHYLTRDESFVVLTEKELRVETGVDIYQLMNNSNLFLMEGGNHAAILL